MKLQQKLIGVGCVSAVLIGGYFWIDRNFHNVTTANYEFKRMHVAPGTLKSVSAVDTKTPVGDSVRTYTVCFTIDSFSDVPRDLQSEYAQAERTRIANDGPRCLRVRNQRSIEGTPEEAVQVYYLLYGHGAITVERLRIRSQELNAM